jgi:ribosomal protein S18 acetylase RimI-like enzyme
MPIRLANLNDLAPLADLLKRVVPAMRAAGNLQWDENYPNAEAFTNDIERAQLWVAEIDGSLAGVIAITGDVEPDYVQADWDHAEPALVVHRLAVDPEFRGTGIARALMSCAEAVAASQGIAVIRVDTNIENQATQKLFPSLGYRFAGEISLRMRPGQRFLCYEKRLTTS